MRDYGEIPILWYDGAWLAHEGTDADAAWLWEPLKLNRLVRQYQPDIVLNPRSGFEGDFKCNEGDDDITGGIFPTPWEKCFTISKAWGYTEDEEIMPLDRIITHIVNAAVRNGNTLINVAPDSDGVIPAAAVNRMRELGNWLQTYGDSIYGTRGGPIQPVDGVFGTTQKGNRVYLHILSRERLAATPITDLKPVTDCRLLDGRSVPYLQSDNRFMPLLPQDLPEEPDTVLVLSFNS